MKFIRIIYVYLQVQGTEWISNPGQSRNNWLSQVELGTQRTMDTKLTHQLTSLAKVKQQQMDINTRLATT